MPFATGTYTLGPESATLTVRTGKRGAAAKAGHNLEITVSSWSAHLELTSAPEQSSLSLSADSRTLRVIAGTGGIQALADDDRANIEQTIGDEVLRGGPISFTSTAIAAATEGGDEATTLRIRGELNLLGHHGPLDFTLTIAGDGTFDGTALVVQTDFGLQPYSTLFGTLKVADEVEVSVAGTLPTP